MTAIKRPGRGEAKLTLVLWLAVMSFVTPAALISGNVRNIYDALSLSSGLVTGLFLSALLFAMYRLARRLPLSGKVAVCAIGTIVCAILQSGGDFGSHYLLDWTFKNTTPRVPGVTSILVATLTYFCIYACNVAIYWILDSLELSRSQESRLARTEARAATAELERLRLQLNPHFMSNSLNTVSALLMTRRYEDADQVTRKLSEFLRAAASEQEAEVPLSEELGVVDSYLEVEAARFGDRLDVSIDCSDDAADALVPGFIVQPLVENAIKHGVARSDGSIRLAIVAKRDVGDVVIEVRNTRTFETGEPHTSAGGIGLNNIRTRLAMRYGTAASFSHGAVQDWYLATIRLPYTAV